jgi:hypothetical protein
MDFRADGGKRKAEVRSEEAPPPRHQHALAGVQTIGSPIENWSRHGVDCASLSLIPVAEAINLRHETLPSASEEAVARATLGGPPS